MKLNCEVCGKSLVGEARYLRLQECKGWRKRGGQRSIPDEAEDVVCVCSGPCLEAWLEKMRGFMKV